MHDENDLSVWVDIPDVVESAESTDEIDVRTPISGSAGDGVESR